jgi:hypothetical protein
MSAVIDQLIVYLQEYWQRGDCPVASSPVLLEGSRRKTDSANRKFELAEDLIALRYYSYIRYVGTELRHLLFFLVVGFSLLFLALHTYAFRADQTIDWSLIALFLVLGSGVVWVLMQQERDALLSRLQRTNADEIGKNFYLDLLKYGALPILTLLGTQVPWISNSLLRWLQPSLEAFH